MFLTKERISRSRWIAAFLPVLLHCSYSGISTTPMYCCQQNSVNVTSHPTRLQFSEPSHTTAILWANAEKYQISHTQKQYDCRKGSFLHVYTCLLKLTTCQKKKERNEIKNYQVTKSRLAKTIWSSLVGRRSFFCLHDWRTLSMSNTLYHNCIYNSLPEDEPSVSKHVEDIVY
jgi:hypothetical protein